MNRGILFRGFHESENGKETIYIDGREIKGFWVYGYYFIHNPELGCFSFDQKPLKHLIIKDGFCDWGFEPPINSFEVIPETVGQFTGVTANGKKIFEGDIVNFKTAVYHYKNCRIKYQVCSARYCAIDNHYYEYPMMNEETFEYEIIGNIFSNPEILRSEK